MTDARWPALAVEDWNETRDTFHLWTQIVGKIRMVSTPAENHWWHVPLYVSARGLTTGAIPYTDGVFDIEFDLLAHELVIRRSTGDRRSIALRPMSVATFYREVTDAMLALGIQVSIYAVPNEVDPAIPFAQDETHASYDASSMVLFWRQLVQAQRVLREFRSGFIGKASPVHLFWGALDLAVTRFSGRPAPRYPGEVPNCPNRVMVEGYSHELSSAGFWPGGGAEGAFYSYAYPAPDGFADAAVPTGAFYSDEYGEFLLPYEVVRASADPDRLVLDFLDATYHAAADLAEWPARSTVTR
ncbi:DUF5996 family protein [Lacisediminihabitans changchengi]|uniref:Ava_C0101 and related proteins n=1 Tax=Lacisediminihabitans changchengi TaxID=2787634 RepID=A0A934SJ18_9MICO|nr:DUF5996 family protein [Lacisediminihabitans changchengi]MBK4346269.1 hypothetical protein [Lacisediminihabitans changchengi]